MAVAAALAILVPLTVVVRDWATIAPAATPVPVLVNGMLIDSTGADPIPDTALAIQAGRMMAVGPRPSAAIPAVVVVIDVQGGTMLPGFINAHVHHAYEI